MVMAPFHSCRHGLGSIPEEWVLRVSRAEELLGYIETIVQL